MAEEQILLKDLPEGLKSDVHRALAHYTIAFVRDPENATTAKLAGSGVLVRVGETRAILTAHHVLQKLPTEGSTGIFLRRGERPFLIESDKIHKIKIARGRNEIEGPDLGVAILPATDASSIGAVKSFADLARHRERVLAEPLDVQSGPWFVDGFLDERGVVRPDPSDGVLTKYLYNFMAITAPDPVHERDGFDYYDMRGSQDVRSKSPVHYGGMSGSGIWQARIRKADGKLTHEALTLSGIAFAQLETTDTEYGVRGHGRKSVYGPAYSAITSRG